MSKRICFVISHYLGRKKDDLEALINQLYKFKSDIFITINDDKALHETFYSYDEIRFLIRPNIGMNIGGWSSAIKYCQDYEKVIFLQDECKILKEDFAEHYIELLDEENIGIIGETINPKWAESWNVLKKSPVNYMLNTPDGRSTSRIDFYHSCLLNWGINPGSTGLHLRALTWAFNNSFLNIIKEFPSGVTKEECIAAEIGVNKLVEHHKLRISQSSTKAFNFISHKEWNINGLSKIYAQ